MFITCYGSQPIETWLPQSQQCPPHHVPPSLSTGKLLHHREADGFEYVSSCSPKHQGLWINKQNNNIAVQHSACTHCKLVVVQGHLCADRDVTDPAFFAPTPDMTTTGLSCLLVETWEAMTWKADVKDIIIGYSPPPTSSFEMRFHLSTDSMEISI